MYERTAFHYRVPSVSNHNKKIIYFNKNGICFHTLYYNSEDGYIYDLVHVKKDLSH